MTRALPYWSAYAAASCLLGACLLPDAAFEAQTSTFEGQGGSAAIAADPPVEPSEVGGSNGSPSPGDSRSEAPPNAPLSPPALNGGTAALPMQTGPDAGVPRMTGVDAGPPPVVPEPVEPMGSVEQACASSLGTLESGTTVCLLVANAARVTWQAAALACQSRNSTLVSIKTGLRDALITSLITTDVWLGASDPGTNPAANAFVWRDLSPVAGFSNWAAAEPDGVADQFCVSKDPMGGWHDRPCSELKAYVCEQAL